MARGEPAPVWYQPPCIVVMGGTSMSLLSNLPFQSSCPMYTRSLRLAVTTPPLAMWLYAAANDWPSGDQEIDHMLVTLPSAT